MPKRPQISITGRLYSKLRAHADKTGIKTINQAATPLIEKLLDAEQRRQAKTKTEN